MAEVIKTAVVGCGLMGGSIAKALLSAGGYFITAFDRDAEVLRRAEAAGAAHAYTMDAGAALRGAELVVLCLYPALAADFMTENMNLFKSGAVVTDICGVKRWVMDRILPALRPDIAFVPAHPMAGREKKGFDMSDGALFRGCNYLIIKDGAKIEAVRLVERMARDLGAGKIVYTQPERHDEYIAYTSQLAHAISCAYVRCMGGRPVADHAAGSMRDVSRVANINAPMWAELFAENADNIAAECERMAKELSELAQFIKNREQEKISAYMQQCADAMEGF